MCTMPLRLCPNTIIRSLSRLFVPVSREKLATDFLKRTIESTQISAPSDWKKVREEIIETSGPRGQITLSNVDAMTVGICTSLKKYDLASSYIQFLNQEKIQLNLATLGKYFKLLYVKNMELVNPEDEQKIIDLYQKLRKSYPILDPATLDNVSQALSITKDWKKYLPLIDEIKIATVPSVHTYSAFISASFRNHEDSLGWKLMDDSLAHGRYLLGNVYISYFQECNKIRQPVVVREKLDVMFNYLHKNSLKLPEETMEALLPLNDEFVDLKTRILRNVIIGKDIYTKTNPAELQKFKEFINNLEHHDVVVDGLNVAYSSGIKQSAHYFSGLVAAVVSHFVKEKKKVLVLGRNHMNKWPKKNWGFVINNATVFLTQDLSQDDPYLLYCALNCGKNTIIVTRDLMRSHKFLLRDAHLKNLFDRWLSQRQYQLNYVNDNGQPIFRLPSPFTNLAQNDGKCWHLPLEEDPKSNNPNKWICLT